MTAQPRVKRRPRDYTPGPIHCNAGVGGVRISLENILKMGTLFRICFWFHTLWFDPSFGNFSFSLRPLCFPCAFLLLLKCRRTAVVRVRELLPRAAARELYPGRKSLPTIFTAISTDARMHDPQAGGRGRGGRGTIVRWTRSFHSASVS